MLLIPNLDIAIPKPIALCTRTVIGILGCYLTKTLNINLEITNQNQSYEHASIKDHEIYYQS